MSKADSWFLYEFKSRLSLRTIQILSLWSFKNSNSHVTAILMNERASNLEQIKLELISFFHIVIIGKSSSIFEEFSSALRFWNSMENSI